MLINRDDAIAVCENDSYFPEEGAHFAKALRALPVSDGVTDEMVELAAKILASLAYDRQYCELPNQPSKEQFIDVMTASYTIEARAALEAALGPLPAPPTIEGDKQ